MRRVLLVEDEPTLCRVIARNLTAHGHEVTTASSVEAAREALEGQAFDVMLLDIDLPDGTGWEVVRHLREVGRDLPFVVVSALRVHPERLDEFRPLAYLPKPFPLDALLRIAAGEGAHEAAED
ncbi:MAG: response regulator [Dehalococcoidia bacterium]|nr:response regulator [Dehalococcoidia bacterium]